MRTERWDLVLPVKGGVGAKSRLGPAGAVRVGLARAIALDCVAAVTGCAVVTRAVVVTLDVEVRREALALGAVVVPESRPGAGLLAAVRDGLAACTTGPAGVLLADLPALRPDDLALALAACGRALRDGAGAVVVPDAEGSGSVLLAGAAADLLQPAFGPGSALAHEAGGARRLELELPGLRRDVDTPAELAAAESLGVGPRTAEVLRRWRPAPA